MQRLLNKKSGFTVLEIITVVGIIAVLFSIATLSFNSSTQKARDVKRLDTITKIKKALNDYKISSGSDFFPGQEEGEKHYVSGSGDYSGICLAVINGNEYSTENKTDCKILESLKKFIPNLPKDPLASDKKMDYPGFFIDNICQAAINHDYIYVSPYPIKDMVLGSDLWYCEGDSDCCEGHYSGTQCETGDSCRTEGLCTGPNYDENPLIRNYDYVLIWRKDTDDHGTYKKGWYYMTESFPFKYGENMPFCCEVDGECTPPNENKFTCPSDCK